MAPRTTNAPWSGVQKMTGLSLAEKVLTRLSGPAKPGTSLMVGNPRSLPAGPPKDSYLSRIGPKIARAPVAGVKNILPLAKSCANPSATG